MARVNPNTATGRSDGDIPAPLTGNPALQVVAHQAPNARFLLMHHYNRWSVMGDTVVPVLGRMPIQPGVGMVDRAGKHTAAMANKVERGWKIIPENVDGEGTSYLHRHPVRGGHYWCTRWEKIWKGSDRVGSDSDGYQQWLLSLVDRDIISPPPVYVLERMLEGERREIIEAARSLRSAPPQLIPTLNEQIELHEARIKVIEAAIAEMEPPESDGVEPEPLPKRKRKRADA